jgi:hypothetical protein
MPTIGFVAPLLPGATQTDREVMASCWTGDRRAAYADSRRRAGITRESVWHQSTPLGDVAVIVTEADDLDIAFSTLATSDDPFDKWFRDHVRAVHGFSLEDGFPPPELIFDYHSAEGMA